MLAREDLINLITSELSQAPVAGYTDYPFRKIARKHGFKGLLFTEMVSGRGYLMNPDHLSPLLKFDEEDRPIGMQVFGSDPDAIAETASLLEQRYRPELIDINMGCPARKVTGKQGGAALLKNPKLAEEIIRKTKTAVSTPLSIKTRIGWSINDVKSRELIQIAEDNDLFCVFLHLRSKKALFTGELELDNFIILKEFFNIPLIANGGIYSKQAYDEITDFIKPMGTMVGLGSMGNPWIYNVNSPGYQIPSIPERLNTMVEHLDLIIKEYNEIRGIQKFRKFMKSYLKGIPNHSKFLPQLVLLKTRDEIVELLRKNYTF